MTHPCERTITCTYVLALVVFVGVAAFQVAAWHTGALIVFGTGAAFALLSVGIVLLGRELARRSRLTERSALRTGHLPMARVIADATPVRDRDELCDAREAVRFGDLFRGALGHDLRNPLTVITAGSASLSRRVTSSIDRKLVDRMSSSAHRMARMIAQLLELVQLRLGRGLELDRQRMDLGALARDVLDQIDVAYPERAVTLVTGGELVGVWDHERLAEVIRDLVENALEHGRSDAAVSVAVRARESSVVVEVRNKGNPIPAELMPLVFDPFRRAEERKRMKSSGLGVSLYLTEQIVRAHGGTIGVISTERATIFTVVLPRHE